MNTMRDLSILTVLRTWTNTKHSIQNIGKNMVMSKAADDYPINLCQLCFDFRKPLNSLYGKKENISHQRG